MEPTTEQTDALYGAVKEAIAPTIAEIYADDTPDEQEFLIDLTIKTASAVILLHEEGTTSDAAEAVALSYRENSGADGAMALMIYLEAMDMMHQHPDLIQDAINAMGESQIILDAVQQSEAKA